MHIKLSNYGYMVYIKYMERIEFYTDYRHYLRDYFQFMKKKNKVFSARYFCQKSGIQSPSRFKEVADGKRNLTDKTIKAFIKGLGLTRSDGVYFTLLVRFNQAGEPEEKQRYFEQMRGLRRRVRQHLLPIDQYELYTDWYYLAIRELACLIDWKDDYRVLARSVLPPIKMSQARDAVNTLVKLGFIEKNNSGRYVQTHPAVTSGPEVNSLGVRSINRKLAVMGTESIDRFPPAERDVTSLVVGASRETYSIIKEEIREFQNRLIRLVDDDKNSDRVYNINFQLFPLSGSSSEEGANES